MTEREKGRVDSEIEKEKRELIAPERERQRRVVRDRERYRES